MAGAAVAVAFVTVVGVVLLVSSAIQFGQLYDGYVLEFVIAVVIALIVGVVGGAICSVFAGALVALAGRKSQSRWRPAWLASVGGLVGATLASFLSYLMLGSFSPLWLVLVFAPLAAVGYFFVIFTPRPDSPLVGASAPGLDLA